MTKRILAMLLSLLLVFSAAFLSACGKNDSDSDEDDSSSEGSGKTKIDVENAAPDEVLKDSIGNLVTDMLPESFLDSVELPSAGDFTSELSDFSIGMKLAVNKLSMNGTDPLNGKGAKAEVEAIVDGDNYAVEANVDLELMGEKPSASAIINADGIYLTDVFGVVNKDLYIEAPIGEYIDQIKAAMEQNSLSEEEAQKIIDAFTAAIEAIEKAIDSNITDAAYTGETKTVTIDGVEFKDAYVVTLTLTPEILKGLATDIVTDVLAIEAIKEFMSENSANLDDAIANITEEINRRDFPTIYVTSTVADGDVVGFDILASMEGEEEAIKVSVATVGENFKLKFGMVENGEFTNDYMAIEYTYDESSKAEKLVVGLADGGERQDLLVAEGTYSNNKHEGTLSINRPDGAVSFKYALKVDDDSFSVNIKDITTNMDGATVTVPLDMTISAKANDKEFTLGFEIKLSMEDTAEIDMSAEISIKACDVDIKAPSSYVSIEEVTEDDLMGWLEDVQNKFPNIMSFIEALMAPSEPDYSVNEDYYYDDTYPEDDFGYANGF